MRWALYFLLLSGWSGYAQQITDLHDLDRMVEEIKQPLYNLDYDATLKKIDALAELLPQHPVVDFLYGLNIVWKTMPDSDPPEFPQIKAYLESSLEKAEAILDTDKDDIEATFFLVMANGLLAQYHGEQGSTFKAVSAAKAAYSAVIKGMDLKERYVEYYFSSGLYNYYREKYPELYPVYKSFVWIFRSGDKEAGLQQIRYAMENATLADTEAAHYLAFINMRLENRPDESIRILNALLVDYPDNIYFKMMKVEAMHMEGLLASCEGDLISFIESDRSYTKMYGHAYYGMYAEQVEHNLRKALSHYQTALELADTFEAADHPTSVAYAGMARTSDAHNDISAAVSYYKKARKLALAQNIRDEAEAYLKSH